MALDALSNFFYAENDNANSNSFCGEETVSLWNAVNYSRKNSFHGDPVAVHYRAADKLQNASCRRCWKLWRETTGTCKFKVKRGDGFLVL